MTSKPPLAVLAREVAADPIRSRTPEPFFSRLQGREKRRLGDAFGLHNFGVNLTVLDPGGMSALLHRHKSQDEFIYVLEGESTLVTDRGDVPLRPGMCAGFPAGGVAHQLVNRTDAPVTYLEVGDRTAGDEATYPNDDLKAAQEEGGRWVLTHKDGGPY